MASPASLHHTLVGTTFNLMDDLTQLRKGSLELAVLALLSVDSRYGGEIVDDLATRPGLEASTGTIYPLLTRLKNSGMVSTTWQESPVGPPRKYYALTAAGLAQLTAQRQAWTQLTTAMKSLLQEVER